MEQNKIQNYIDNEHVVHSKYINSVITYTDGTQDIGLLSQKNQKPELSTKNIWVLQIEDDFKEIKGVDIIDLRGETPKHLRSK